MEAPPYRTLGRRITRARESAGLQKQEVAEQARISRSYLSLIEDGQRQPRPAKLRSIARVLGLDYAELAELAGYIDGQGQGGDDDPELSALLNRVRRVYPREHVMRIEHLLAAAYLEPGSADRQAGDEHQQLRQDHGPHPNTD